VPSSFADKNDVCYIVQRQSLIFLQTDSSKTYDSGTNVIRKKYSQMVF